MLPSGCERGSSLSKRRGDVDGGGDSESETRAGGVSPHFQQLTSPSHPFSGMVPGTRGAIYIDDAQCFLDESFWQRCHNNINAP